MQEFDQCRSSTPEAKVLRDFSATVVNEVERASRKSRAKLTLTTETG